MEDDPGKVVCRRFSHEVGNEMSNENKSSSKSDSEQGLLYTLSRGPLELSVCSLGATLTRLLVPGANGQRDDITLGFDSQQEYQNASPSPYFGCVVGRVANRIEGASFTLDGKSHSLSANDGLNTLHGGSVGFDKCLFSSSDVSSELGRPAVRFSLLSPHGDQGFPGDLQVTVTYSLPASPPSSSSPTSLLRIDMEARPLSSPTPVSLAHHAYWNLGGHDSEDVLGHSVSIPAAHYTPVDENLIATGEIRQVQGTPFDLRSSALLADRMPLVSGGFDHNFVLDKQEEQCLEQRGSPKLFLAARVEEPSSGRIMEVFTSADGVQFYTGNFLDGSVRGKGGVAYRKHAGLCLETQAFPNAVNLESFPSIIVHPGETYRHVMLLRFTLLDGAN